MQAARTARTLDLADIGMVGKEGMEIAAREEPATGSPLTVKTNALLCPDTLRRHPGREGSGGLKLQISLEDPLDGLGQEPLDLAQTRRRAALGRSRLAPQAAIPLPPPAPALSVPS